MTIKRALERFIDDIFYRTSGKGLPLSLVIDYDFLMSLLKDIKQELDRLEILEQKKIPMKPIRYNINQYKCPKCLNQIKGKKWIYNMDTKRFDIKSKIKVEKVYCPVCGQKLDWSEDDEK